MRFERCDYVITAQSTHRQRSMMNEKQNQRMIAKCEFAASTKNDSTQKFDSTSISKNQLNNEIRVREESNASSESFETSEKQISDAYKN